jgi:hypothetical protein
MHKANRQSDESTANVRLNKFLSKAHDSDETHFVFPLEQPYDINHLTVFLTGGMYLEHEFFKGLIVVPFPEGYGASVHFAWPNKDYIPLGVYVHPFCPLYRSMRRSSWEVARGGNGS